ncbi:hypothetical protein [Limnothrix redekei]|uniref:Uncharacterized protein n=1 Tax=Limnothrix redekei LRLZ20PSL1 TaxID=3112953 RepID=A0ABW7C4U0_9CYAN
MRPGVGREFDQMLGDRDLWGSVGIDGDASIESSRRQLPWAWGNLSLARSSFGPP